jgi:hypothetical protein
VASGSELVDIIGEGPINDWMTGKGHEARQRVRRVLEENPDLPLARRAMQDVQAQIRIRGRSASQGR